MQRDRHSITFIYLMLQLNLEFGENGTSVALRKDASDITFIFILLYADDEVISKTRVICLAKYCFIPAQIQDCQVKITINSRHQLGNPYSAGNFPARKSRNMNDEDLLRYIENLEDIIARKQERILSLNARSGTDERSKCMAYSMSQSVNQIRKESDRLKNELKRIYAITENQRRSEDPPPKESLSCLAGFLEQLFYHTKILHQLLDNIQKNRWTSAPGFNTSDLNKSVRYWIDRVRKSYSGDIKLSIRSRLNNHIPELSMTESELFQIIYHLLMNAIEALIEGRDGEISVRTDLVGEYVLLEVMDNGYGIRTEIRRKIFDQSYTTKNIGTYDNIHTGVGLYIIEKIVSNCGGKIEVESNQGIGSVFSIFLPIERKQTDRPGRHDNT
ncbi:MAG: sensor histidine kinase [Candidatus Krumholzibacteriota bacterium]|nr:sensor histidine kinase [Candidatus Krumholzibacteriota bacterium]